MTDRALGLVYPANQYAGEDLPFADNGEILDWMKGYVHEAVQAGILEGYPDNTFRPNQTSTRAEAVVMIQRMLHEMEQGLNPSGITLLPGTGRRLTCYSMRFRFWRSAGPPTRSACRLWIT